MKCLCGKEKAIQPFETLDEIGTEWVCPSSCIEVFSSFDTEYEPIWTADREVSQEEVSADALVWANLRGATNDSVVLADEIGHRRYWRVPQGQPIPVLR